MLMGERHVNGGFPAIHSTKTSRKFSAIETFFFFFNILKKKRYLLFLPVSSVRDFLVEDVPAVPVKRKRTLSRNKTFLNRLLKHALL